MSQSIHIPLYMKCRRAQNRLKEEGLTTDVIYYDHHGNQLVQREEENTKFCVVMADDTQLREDLFKNRRTGGAWSTASKFEITDDAINDADIPVNQASCKRTRGVRTKAHLKEVFLGDLVGASRTDPSKPFGNRCQVTELHVHDGHSPSAHLHVRCNNSTLDTIDNLVDVILDANIQGNAMCKEGRQRARELSLLDKKTGG